MWPILPTYETVPMTSKVVSSNPAHGEVYSIQHQVIKFVSDWLVVSSTNKTDRHDITEILLKVALNIIPNQPTKILLKVALNTIPNQPIYKLLIYTVFYFITFQVNLVNWLVRQLKGMPYVNLMAMLTDRLQIKRCVLTSSRKEIQLS